MATIEERIKALEERLKQEKARKAQIEARKRAAAAKLQRSQDTRKKVLVGAWLMNIMSKDGVTAQNLSIGQHRLSDYITRDEDRKVLGLEPRTQPAQAPAAPAVSAAPTQPVQPQVIAAARPSFDDFVSTPRAQHRAA